MRNREAARYARWAAIAAGLIALAGRRRVQPSAPCGEFRACRGRVRWPFRSPCSSNRRNSRFPRSSRIANDFHGPRVPRHAVSKTKIALLLEDVWITLYGRDGSRNDNIHTGECSYEPARGDVRCEGEVKSTWPMRIPRRQARCSADTLQVKTSNLSFNRNTGEASTPRTSGISLPRGRRTRRGSVLQHERFDRAHRAQACNSIWRIGADGRHAGHCDGKQPRNPTRRPHGGAEGPRDSAGRRMGTDCG